MERRQIVGIASGAACTGGIAAMTAGVINHVASLEIVGFILIASGVGGLAGLFLTAPTTKKNADKGYVTLRETGRLIYERHAHIRQAMGIFLPDAFSSAEHGVETYARTAAQEMNVQIYGRRSPLLPLESMTPRQVHETASNAEYDPKTAEFHDLSIRRRNLKRVVGFYDRRP